MEVLSLVVQQSWKKREIIIYSLNMVPRRQWFPIYLAGRQLNRVISSVLLKLDPCTARKANTVQSVAATRGSTAEQGPHHGKSMTEGHAPTKESQGWHFWKSQRRYKCTKPTNKQTKKHRRPVRKARTSWRIFFPTYHLFLCTQPFPVSKPLCLSSFIHKTSRNNTSKSLHVRLNSTPLLVNTSHCAP